MNAANAAMIRLIVPHAACRPSMIAISAPAAGTIIETSFSTRIATNAAGIATSNASIAISRMCSLVSPPSSRSSRMMPPIPSSSNTLLLNHSTTVVLNADHR